VSGLTRRSWWSKLFTEDLPAAGVTRCVEFRQFADGRLSVEVWEEGPSARSGVMRAELEGKQRMELWNLLTHGKESKPPADPSKKRRYPPLRMPKERSP
jgi:hypothetical protein